MPWPIKPFRNPFHLLTGSSLLFLILSWWKIFLTGNIKVDENFLSGWQIPVLIGGVLCAFFFALKAILRLFQSPENLPFPYWVLFFSFCTPPFLSNDVFSYFYYGQALAHGYDVYRAFDGSNLSWYGFVGERYLSTPSVYGLPLLILYATLGNFVGFHVYGSLILLKLFHLLALFLISTGLSQYHKNEGTRNWLIALPLVWIEGLANLHNEFLLLPLCIWGIVFYYRKKIVISIIMWGLAAWCKFSFVLFLFWPILDKNGPYVIREKLRSFLFGGILLLGAHAITWFAVFRNIQFYDGIYLPLKTVSSLGPSSSLADIFYTVIRLFLSPVLAHSVNKMINLFMQGASVILFLLILKRNHHASPPYLLWMMSVIFITIFSHRILAWYFLMLIPLWNIKLSTVWVWWLVIVSMIYSTQGLIQFTHPDLIFTKAVTVVLVGGGVVALFIWFKKRFLVISNHYFGKS